MAKQVAATLAVVAGSTSHVVSPVYVSLASAILFDESITPSTRALMLSEQVGRAPFLHTPPLTLLSAPNTLRCDAR